MEKVRRFNTYWITLSAFGVMVMALMLWQGVTWAAESERRNAAEESRTINAGNIEAVTPKGEGITPDHAIGRAFCTTGLVPSNFFINFTCTCPAGFGFVYSCGLNSVSNLAWWEIRDMYPIQSRSCFYSIANRGGIDRAQSWLVCGF